jgi:alpha-tubulin suppressor-like RCC1 family protein
MPDIEIVKLKTRRGTDTQRQLIVLEEGELGYTIDTKRVFVGDGATSGGTSVTTRSHTIDANIGSTYAQIGDILYKDGRLLQLSAADFTQIASWAYVGPRVDNITIALSSWGSSYNLALIQSGILVLSGLTNTGAGLTINVDGETVSFDSNNSLYVPVDGITSNEIANGSIVSYKISSDALATLGGITLNSGKLKLTPGNALSIDSSNVLNVDFDNSLTLNDSGELSVAPTIDVLHLSQGIGLSGANSYIHTNNQIYGYGLQTNSSLGLGTITQAVALPRRVLFNSNYLTLTELHNHMYNSYAIDLSGNIYAAGLNTNYQAGVNAPSPIVSFTKLVLSGTSVPLSGVRSFTTSTGTSAVEYSLYAVTSASKAYAWGDNSAGQLGRYNTTAVQQPVLIQSLSSTNVQYMKAVGSRDGTTAYALISTGSVYVCGSNSSGQLGINYGIGTGLTGFRLLSTVTDIVSIYTVGELMNNSVWFVSNTGSVSAAGFNNALSPLGCPTLGNVTGVALLTALSGGDRYCLLYTSPSPRD